MKWNNRLLYAHLEGLASVFSYKRPKNIKLEKIPELSKKVYDSMAFRPHIEYLLDNYVELANLINSGTVTVRTIDLYYLGEFVKTNAFPKISTFNNLQRLKEVINFYNAKSINEQIEQIVKTSEANNTKFAKFTKQNKSVFELSDQQTNLLYDMMVSGKISVFVYAYFMKEKKFEIDFGKIKNVEIYRNNKIAEYVSTFDLEDILM